MGLTRFELYMIKTVVHMSPWFANLYRVYDNTKQWFNDVQNLVQAAWRNW